MGRSPLDDYDRYAARVMYSSGRSTVRQIAVDLRRAERWVREQVRDLPCWRGGATTARARNTHPDTPAGSPPENPA